MFAVPLYSFWPTLPQHSHAMSVSPASLPQGRSSVPQCRVLHFTVITLLLVCNALCTVASSQPKDECQQNQVTFADKILTIGWIDDELWAITKSDWNVYKLTPCKPANYSLVHCMEVDSPVKVDTKWPKLAESVKSAAHATDFTFPVDNSVVMDSSAFGHTILAMHSDSFNGSKYFGFVFGKNDQVQADVFGEMKNAPGLWISSDVKDKAYSLFEYGKKEEQILCNIVNGLGYLLIAPNSSQKSICQTGSKSDLQVQFQDGECNPSTVWSVSKGVLFKKQFYLFASDLVYIFSDQAETGSTRMQTVALADFFHCYEPSTMPHPTSPNATNHQFTANSTHMSTTVKGSHTTLIVIIVLVVVFLLICCCACCFCCVQASKTGKGVGNSKPSSSSMKDSKVSIKAPTSSKGPANQAQPKANTPKVSPGKQSQPQGISPGPRVSPGNQYQSQGISPATKVSPGNQSQPKVTTPAPKVPPRKISKQPDTITPSRSPNSTDSKVIKYPKASKNSKDSKGSKGSKAPEDSNASNNSQEWWEKITAKDFIVLKPLETQKSKLENIPSK